ncbi:MAG: hypothetical protein ABI783_05230 [Actinomycetota bacterium]
MRPEARLDNQLDPRAEWVAFDAAEAEFRRDVDLLGVVAGSV